MQVLVATVLLWILRRIRPATLAFAVYGTWRRLPPTQRRKLLFAAGRHAPKVASMVARRGRPLR